MRPSHRRPRHGSFPTTADMGLWARGRSAEELYEGLALAWSSATTDRRRVRGRETREIELSASDPVGLAVGFLGRVLTLFQLEGFLLRTAKVRLAGRRKLTLTATLVGEPFDEERHSRKIEIKAITFHQALFDVPGGYARLVVDI
jgi:SHS2 domain-containing protein